MSGRIGDGNGNVGRFAEIVEDAQPKTDKSAEAKVSDADAKSTTHEVSDGLDTKLARNALNKWKSNTSPKTNANSALRPPSHSATNGSVEIREKRPQNLARINFEIIRRPDDLNAENITFDVRVNGRDYEMAVRGPITEAQLEKIAANSAKACGVLEQSGVKSFEKATLESSGSVNVDSPELGSRGPIADQVRSTLKDAKLSPELDVLRFESDGSVEFHVPGREEAFELSAKHMRSAPFLSPGEELTNLAEALKTYAKLSCPDLSSTTVRDPSSVAKPTTPTKPATTEPTDQPSGQIIMRPLEPSREDVSTDRPNANGNVSGVSNEPSIAADDVDLPSVVVRPKPSTPDIETAHEIATGEKPATTDTPVSSTTVSTSSTSTEAAPADTDHRTRF